MRWMRSNLTQFFAILALSAFLSVLVVETFHHHDSGESSSCSICSWQQNTSQSTPTTIFPHLNYSCISFKTAETKETQASFVVVKLAKGRSPPNNLL